VLTIAFAMRGLPGGLRPTCHCMASSSVCAVCFRISSMERQKLAVKWISNPASGQAI